MINRSSMIMKIILILGLYSLLLSFGDEDPYPRFWYAVGKDSAYLWVAGGSQVLSAGEVLKHSKKLDSLCNKQSTFKCVFNYHIGTCDSNKVHEYQMYTRTNKIRVGGIACRDSSRQMQIVESSNKMELFNKTEFEKKFREANDDSDYFENEKIRRAKIRDKNREFRKKYKGMVPERILHEIESSNQN
jgi:hypothetical protein